MQVFDIEPSAQTGGNATIVGSPTGSAATTSDKSAAEMVKGTSADYTTHVYKTLKDVGEGFSAELTRLQNAKIITTDGEYASNVKQVDGGFTLGPMCKLGYLGGNGNSQQYGFHPDAMIGGPWYTDAHRHPDGGSRIPSGTDIAQASQFQTGGHPHGAILTNVDGHGMIYRPNFMYPVNSLNGRSPSDLLKTYKVDATW